MQGFEQARSDFDAAAFDAEDGRALLVTRFGKRILERTSGITNLRTPDMLGPMQMPKRHVIVRIERGSVHVIRTAHARDLGIARGRLYADAVTN